MSNEAATETANDALLRAMLALQIADRDERLHGADPRRSEVVLADAGLTLTQIASITGRKYEAVKGAVRRAREAEQARTTPKSSKGRPAADD